MPPNLRPPERAVGKSRQEGDGMRKVSLPAQENLEGCVLRRDDGTSFWVVANALTTCEPSLSRRGRARVGSGVGNCANQIRHVKSPVLGVSAARPTPLRADRMDAPENRKQRGA